jgi:carbamoyl-phosphate synthase small subunit
MTQSSSAAPPSEPWVATALLVLEDGTTLAGRSIGAQGETFGELVFNTGMTGYQEVLTDPSYRGQIVVMTYPEIGIYGVNTEDVESGKIQVNGFVVHRAVTVPFNQRATQSFPQYLGQAGVVAIEGVDTRQLTRRLRTQGAMRGAISTLDLSPDHLLARVRQSPSIVGRDLAKEVRPTNPLTRRPVSEARFHIVLVDAGAKEGILDELAVRKVDVSIVPYDIDVDAVTALSPSGVVISNGPGDPAALRSSIALVRQLVERRIPLMGICLGHQLLGLALGGRTYKMRFGHRGLNHPVKDLAGGQIIITTHNHGFAVDPTSLGIPWEPSDAAFSATNPSLLDRNRRDAETTMADRLPDRPLIGVSPVGLGPVIITHLSLNDGTLEGMRLRDAPAFSVQFHPEAAPGTHDAKHFFDQFVQMMEESRAQAR